MKDCNARIVTLVTGLAAALWLAGCATSSPATSKGADAAKPQAKEAKADGRGGAELWGQNCGHCHNIRSPSAYNNAQWDVVMLHMRVRANLTAEEHKKILEFLKSAD